MLGKMFKEFFKDKEEELKVQQQERVKEIKHNERQREISEIMQKNLKSNVKAKIKPRFEVQFSQPQQ